MRWKEINEAPIVDYGAYGDLDTEGSFRASDLKAIRNPKWLDKVFSAFEQTQYDFNLYILNAKDATVSFQPKGEGEWAKINVRDLSHLAKWEGVHPLSTIENLIGKRPPAADQRITVLLIENEGAERMPLTPWLVAHRIAHAVLGSGNTRNIGFNSGIQSSVNDFYRYINYFLSNVLFALRYSAHHGDTIKSAEKDRRRRHEYGAEFAAAQLIGKMRSAKSGNLANVGEFFVECMAQYIVQGKVTFERPMLNDKGLGKPFEPLSPKDQKLLDLARKIETGPKLAVRFRQGEDFADWVLRNKTPRKPYSGYLAYDASGDAVASFQDEDRIKKYEDRGYTVKRMEPTKAQISGYEKRIANLKNERDRIANLWDQWFNTGRIFDTHEKNTTETDIFHKDLDRAEKEINNLIHRMMIRCIGKCLVL